MKEAIKKRINYLLKERYVAQKTIEDIDEELRELEKEFMQEQFKELTSSPYILISENHYQLS